MTDREKGGAFGTDGLDAGPEQGGSNMGGLGATGAVDRDRDPEAEGSVKPTQHSAREHALEDQAETPAAPD
ncbi:MAG TPA: hypothetical protein VGD23_00250 [Sphingomicrobium sp.]